MIGSGVRAERADTVAQIIDYAKRGEVIPMSVLDRADEEQNDVQAQIDLMLNYLLSVPFEQRQYIFPALFDTPAMPKKIRTHPEIAIWEGKLPTDIAPEARAYAQKYLADMNPKMYVYLSPDAYAQRDHDRPIMSHSNDLAPAVREAHHIVTKAQKPEQPGVPTRYRSVPELLKQPDHLVQNPDAHLLTEWDIKKIGRGLSSFNLFLNQELEENPGFRSGYNMLKVFYTQTTDERINPFQAKLERLRLMNREADADKFLQRAGWKNTAEFVEKADAMVRAYRAARLPLPLAFDVRRYRGRTPRNATERIIINGSRMYEALPADAHLVAEHLDEVRRAFIETGYQSVLNAETVDEYRK